MYQARPLAGAWVPKGSQVLWGVSGRQAPDGDADHQLGDLRTKPGCCPGLGPRNRFISPSDKETGRWGVAVNSPICRNPKKASAAVAWNIRLSWLQGDLLVCEELSCLTSIPGVIGCLQQLFGELARFERRIPLNSSLRIWLPLTGL
ncbi:hypothetical protein EMCRGX_G030186 [Ephydatia muelleri]